MKRSSGVLMPISSLYGDYSIGSFGKEAKEFIDFLADCGFGWWQVLPFCPVDECNSPYKSHSAFGGNPYFIDLPTLFEEGLITREEMEEQRQQNPYSCEYVRLYHTRLDLLRKTAERAENLSEINAFIEGKPYIKQFCEFMAYKKANGGTPWQEWEKEEADKEELSLWKFIQFHFFRQWADIKAYANQRGIRIIGDIPIYVAPDSADVWGNREQFCLDEGGKPTSVAGVPPDYFSADGQLWGNPLYNWERMKADGYAWWCDRMRHMLELFDGVRIDHFRAMASYWAVPADAETAKAGEWKTGPGMDLIGKLKELAGDKLIIAEDLGDITPDVYELLKESGFPGMRVFQFGFLNPGESTHQPHLYENNCVAYTGTHDNNTLLGYLWELQEGTRRWMLRYCGYESENWEQGFDSIVRTLYASAAGLVILPIQDLLRYGSDTRLNIPGKADGNWQYRITKEQLGGIDRGYYRDLNGLYFR